MNIDTLWGDEFSLPEKAATKKILDKVNKEHKVKTEKTPDKIIKSKKVSFAEKLPTIVTEVNRILGKQQHNVEIIYDKILLHNYLLEGVKFGRIAIDTETNNSLDPITCKLMGLCLYVNNKKQAYVPINHRDPNTQERLPQQLTEKDIQEELTWLMNNKSTCKLIFHNGKFDYEVLKCTCKVELDIDWDTLIGAKLLDENEKSAALKQQYITKIDPNQEKYSIDNLFEGLEYALFSPELFALYAATDAFMTDKLYQWQMEKFKNPDLAKVLNLAYTIEMPLVKVVAEMELAGVELDKEYAERLHVKYHSLKNKIIEKINNELVKYKDQINAWRLTPEANIPQKSTRGDKLGKSKSEQLDDPINLSSPTQLSILLYDILGAKQNIDKKTPRGTGTKILKQINLPICKYLIEYKELEKLLTSFIDALPERVNLKDGRVHCHFNQYGADTGRFSSSDPNLQQIPSHNEEIRLIFKASDNYIMVGSDFSQQEPRLLSCYSKDENMINAYKEGKDLYATIASGVYHNDYWDNMEHHRDGTPNPEGKKRRSSCKSVLLGIMYGRGVASIAEQLNSTIDEAQSIIDNFYKSFPKVKDWMDKTIVDAKRNGYVEDLWGRRRRLPDLLLPKYDIKYVGTSETVFNPLLGCEFKIDSKIEDKIKNYQNQLSKAKYKKEIDNIKQELVKEGFTIRDNSGFIAEAERKCINARIQGGAASMTKVAMIKLFNNQELRNLGFKLLIGVHDELIGECPIKNRERVAELLTTIMKTAAADKCEVPFKCDAEISTCWYLPQYTAEMEEYFDELLENHSEREAFEIFAQERVESTRTQLYEIVKDKLSYVPENINISYKSIY